MTARRPTLSSVAEKLKAARLQRDQAVAKLDSHPPVAPAPADLGASHGRVIADYWPDKAKEFIKKLPRKNDRLIAKWLWLDNPPRSQAAIAEALKMTPAAISQRVAVIVGLLRRQFPTLLFKIASSSGDDGADDPGYSEFGDFDHY